MPGRVLGWRKNAANNELEEVPYNAPFAENVSLAMVRGEAIRSVTIHDPISTPSILSILRTMFSRASAISLSHACPQSDGALTITNQFSHPAGASSGTILELINR